MPEPRPTHTVAFIVLVVGLLAFGLVTLLLLNTALAQGSFRLQSLQGKVDALQQHEQALQQRVAALAAPQRLAAEARALGMVPNANPVFLRAADGKVLGVPEAAAAPAPPPAPAPTPSASSSPTPAPSPSASGSASSRPSAAASAGPTVSAPSRAAATPTPRPTGSGR